MKSVLAVLVLISALSNTYALQISEIMSNPSGDDSGREWIELYNNGSDTVDLSSLTISIKSGNPDTVTSISGGTSVPPQGYAIIGSTVSGQTKFQEDYPGFSGPLFRSSISLVNTSATSLSVSLNGVVVDTLASYTAAKDGKTLSLIGGSFQAGTPTPGEANQAAPVEVSSQSSSSGSTSNSSGLASGGSSSQSSESRIVSSSGSTVEDIVVTLPNERIVIAGAETDFAAKATTKSGKSLPNAIYSWAFGDGGQKVGSSTKYTYAYTGRYIAQVEVVNESVTGNGRMIVKVIAPDVAITNVGMDKYGTYVDITNNNAYELNLSQWRLTFDGASFPFPKNTIIAGSSTVRFGGHAMGFASVLVNASTSVKILFPHLEEVTRYIPTQQIKLFTQNALPQNNVDTKNKVTLSTPKKQIVTSKSKNIPQVLGVSTTTGVATSSRKMAQNQSTQSGQIKDTRLVSWVKGFLPKH